MQTSSFAQWESQQGFSLIELMVTIAILGIVLAIGAPLTSAWIDQAKVDNAANALKSAITQARVMALRNPNNKASDEVATCVKIDADNKIKIYESGCSGTAKKEFDIPSGIIIKQGTASITGNCFAFNANGMSNTASCADALSTSSTITVGKNNETATVDII